MWHSAVQTRGRRFHRPSCPVRQVKPVVIHLAAENELIEAVAFYEERATGLGLDFEHEARRAVKTIQETPERWPLKAHGARRYLMHRFPFALYYLDMPEILWIVAVAHTSRKPGYWVRRLL